MRIARDCADPAAVHGPSIEQSTLSSLWVGGSFVLPCLTLLTRLLSRKAQSVKNQWQYFGSRRLGHPLCIAHHAARASKVLKAISISLNHLILSIGINDIGKRHYVILQLIYLSKIIFSEM